MRRRESRRLLTGVVFADDAVLGGEHAGKPGRGSDGSSSRGIGIFTCNRLNQALGVLPLYGAGLPERT